jgi:hypothetical protein
LHPWHTHGALPDLTPQQAAVISTIQKRIRKDGTPNYRAMVRLRGHEPLYETFNRRTDARDWIRANEQRIKVGEVISSEAARTTLSDALEPDWP